MGSNKEAIATEISNSSDVNIKALNIIRNSPVELNLKCPDCKVEVKTKEKRDEHIERVHNIIPCNRCDIVYKDLEEMQAHYKADHLFKCLFKCANGIAFNSAELLQKHIEAVHTFKCDICSRIFTTESVLQFHHVVVHSNQYQCHLCAIQFVTEELVQTHVTAVHKFQCTQCPRHFTTDTALIFHYDITHGFESFCHLCGDKLANKSSVPVHIASSHSFRCSICSNVSQTEAARKVHERMHRS